jgi:diketogulonate reductase-like aldo/keto reductase
VYETEKEVGEGIQAKVDDGTIKDKSEIFITTKVITNIKKTPNYSLYTFSNFFLGFIHISTINTAIS